MLKNFLLYLIMTLAHCLQVQGQQVSLFQRYTTANGLPSNYVFDAEEDASGNLWLGTDKGLARYDGFNWQLLNTDDGLPGNYVSVVYSDGGSGLWLQIGAKGIYHFQPSEGRVRLVSDSYEHHFLEAGDSGQLYFYRRSPNGRLTAYQANPQQPQHIRELFHVNITQCGLNISTDFRNRTIYIFPSANKLCPGAGITNLVPGWSVQTLAGEAAEGTLYHPVSPGIHRSLSSLYFIDGKRVLKRLPVFKADNAYFNTLRYGQQTITWNEKNGVYFISDDGTTTHYTETDGLGSNLVTRLHVLKNGQLLLCTLGGGISMKLPAGNAAISTGGAAVRGIAQTGNNIYAVTASQLIRRNTTDGKMQTYPLGDKNIQGVDAYGDTIYISTLSGFTRYRAVAGSLAVMERMERHAGICKVLQTAGRIFAGSYGNFILELKNGRLLEDTTTFNISEKIFALNNGIAACNYEDGLQLAAFNGSRTVLNRTNGLPSSAVYHVHEHADTLWVSTRRGLAAVVNNRVVKTYTAAAGVAGSRYIYSFHDTTGMLWVLTDQQLARCQDGRIIGAEPVMVKENASDAVVAAVYHAATNTLYTATLKGVFVNRLQVQQPRLPSAQPGLRYILFDADTLTGTTFSVPRSYKRLAVVFKPFHVNPFTTAVLYYKLEGRDESFIALKDSLTLQFPQLRSGRYRLLVKVVHEDGAAGKQWVACEFTIQKPIYERGWFLALITGLTGILTYIAVTRYQQRKQRRRNRELQLLQQLAEERERISRELHDNLGAGLVTMIALGDSIETRLRNNQTTEALKKMEELGDLGRDTMNILRETIWAVQEQAHSYGAFTGRIRAFLQRTYGVKNIEWTCTVSDAPGVTLTPGQTLHIFRCIQEITQNIIKHSGATAAAYTISVTGRRFVAVVTDNGKGFNTAAERHTNGLHNIVKRMNSLGGGALIQSRPGQGTSITIQTDL